MALYVTEFTDWALANGFSVLDRISVYGMLRSRYPVNVAVPNLGYDLKIYSPQGSISIYPVYDLLTAVVTIDSSNPYFVNSSKNSINIEDYILGSSGNVTIMFEVG